jgi:PIN domain nuclease of toxin-antitoxin system
MLLDTHAFIWFIEGNESLSDRARSVIEDENNTVFLSMASVWEMAIKVSLGKLILSEPFDALIPSQLATNDIALLDINLSHTMQVATLPFYHRDPFDRLIASQALAEDIPLISKDAIFDSYGVNRLW